MYQSTDVYQQEVVVTENVPYTSNSPSSVINSIVIFFGPHYLLFLFFIHLSLRFVWICVLSQLSITFYHEVTLMFSSVIHIMHGGEAMVMTNANIKNLFNLQWSQHHRNIFWPSWSIHQPKCLCSHTRRHCQSQQTLVFSTICRPTTHPESCSLIMFFVYVRTILQESSSSLVAVAVAFREQSRRQSAGGRREMKRGEDEEAGGRKKEKTNIGCTSKLLICLVFCAKKWTLRICIFFEFCERRRVSPSLFECVSPANVFLPLSSLKLCYPAFVRVLVRACTSWQKVL